MSILRSTPNHTSLKYRCPFKISNRIRLTYSNGNDECLHFHFFPEDNGLQPSRVSFDCGHAIIRVVRQENFQDSHLFLLDL